MDIESKAISVERIMEGQLERVTVEEIERIFDEPKNGNRTKEYIRFYKRAQSFIKFYNRTVVDKERFKFSEFRRQWAIQYMDKGVYTSFGKNQDNLIAEIKENKDIQDFFRKYCCGQRKEGSFCSKLFHTIFPAEFPPVDSSVREAFELNSKDFITDVLIVKRAYELYIQNNKEKIALFRKVLSKNKFSNFRVNELSDIRIVDMYYWFKAGLEGALKKNKVKNIITLPSFNNSTKFYSLL